MNPPSPDSSSGGSDGSGNRRDPPPPVPPPPPSTLHDAPVFMETAPEQFKRAVLQHTKGRTPQTAGGPPPAAKFRRVDDTGRTLVQHDFLGTSSGSIRQPTLPPLPPLPPRRPPSHPHNLLMEHNAPSASARMAPRYFRQPSNPPAYMSCLDYMRHFAQPSNPPADMRHDAPPVRDSLVTRDFLGEMERRMNAPKSPSSTESDASKK